MESHKCGWCGGWEVPIGEIAIGTTGRLLHLSRWFPPSTFFLPSYILPHLLSPRLPPAWPLCTSTSNTPARNTPQHPATGSPVVRAAVILGFRSYPPQLRGTGSGTPLPPCAVLQWQRRRHPVVSHWFHYHTMGVPLDCRGKRTRSTLFLHTTASPDAGFRGGVVRQPRGVCGAAGNERLRRLLARDALLRALLGGSWQRPLCQRACRRRQQWC